MSADGRDRYLVWIGHTVIVAIAAKSPSDTTLGRRRVGLCSSLVAAGSDSQVHGASMFVA
jgi:hypothetical protein